VGRRRGKKKGKETARFVELSDIIRRKEKGGKTRPSERESHIVNVILEGTKSSLASSRMLERGREGGKSRPATATASSEGERKRGETSGLVFPRKREKACYSAPSTTSASKGKKGEKADNRRSRSPGRSRWRGREKRGKRRERSPPGSAEGRNEGILVKAVEGMKNAYLPPFPFIREKRKVEHKALSSHVDSFRKGKTPFTSLILPRQKEKGGIGGIPLSFSVKMSKRERRGKMEENQQLLLL